MTRTTRDGFTLAETLVAAAVSALMIVAVLAMFLNQRRTYRNQTHFNEMQQNVRQSMDTVIRDVRMAGYGLKDVDTDLSLWIHWVANVTNLVTVKPGTTASDPDELTVIGAFEAPQSSLWAAVAAGATSIFVPSNAVSLFDTNANGVIFVGRKELVRIRAIAGNQFTISRHHTKAGLGLKYAHPASAPVEKVEAVTYALDLSPTGFPHRPYMTRDDNTGAFVNELQKMMAVGIDDFQVSKGADSITIEIRGKAAAPNFNYTHPTVGDNFRRKTAETTVHSRNI